MHGGLHVLPGERANPARAPTEDAGTEKRTEETGNGILKATAHPNASEDQSAEADDRTRIDRKGLERPRERGRTGEVHRALGMATLANASTKSVGIITRNGCVSFRLRWLRS